MIIDHIGIAVKDIESAKLMYSKILNAEPYKEEIVEEQGVHVVFFKSGKETKVELLQGLHSESPISKYIEKKGEGFHHVAYLVEDINKEIERMISEGFQPLQEKPKKGANNKMVFFFHPKSTGGTLIELCMPIV